MTDTAKTMVERVATELAAHMALYPKGSWEDLARAAIAAMAGPTEAQMDAGWDAWSGLAGDKYWRVICPAMFDAMIQAALAEKTE